MTHPDRELLTQLALNDPLALDAETLVHVADCEQCSAELAGLQRVAAATESLRDDPTLGELIAPPDRVWDQIALSAGIATAQAQPPGESPSKMPRQSDGKDHRSTIGARSDSPVARPRETSTHHVGPRPRRRVAVQLLAAAVVGVLLGALTTWAVVGRDGDADSGNSDTQFTTSDLVGFDGHTTSGVASLTETPDGSELTIELQPEDVQDGFIQAWLLDEDTGGMVALGVVDGDSGTFAVPQELDLNAFNQIDISLEPYDGNPEHSAVSLARGPLP